MRNLEKGMAILVSALLAVSLCGCSAGQDAPSETAAAPDSAQEQQATPQPANNENRDAENTSGSYTIGQTCTTGNFAVQLAAASYEDRVEDGNYLYYEASSGNTFLILVFDIENTSSSEQTIQTVSDFSIYVDGYQVEQTAFGYNSVTVTIDGASYQPLSSEIINPQVVLQPGRKAIGYLVTEVPADWSECEVEFAGATFVCVS